MARRLPRTPAPEAPAPQGHNSAAVEEANRVQFLSILAKLDAADADIENAAAVVAAARKVRKSIIGLAKQADIPEWQLKQRQDELKRTPVENAQRIDAEAKQRRWSGIINPEQMAMHLGDSTPQEVKDAEDAKSLGFRDGVRGRAASLPEKMHPRFHQDYLKGHELGRKDYMLTLAENAPKPRGMTAQQVAEQAAKDFAADNPEPGSPAAKKAERESVARATAALAKIGDTVVTSDEDGNTIVRSVSEGDDGFEASPEELAAQKPRAAIQDAAADEPVV